MQSWVEMIPYMQDMRGVCAPIIQDYVDLLARIASKEVFETFDDDETVFPVVEPVVNLSGVDIDCCR